MTSVDVVSLDSEAVETRIQAGERIDILFMEDGSIRLEHDCKFEDGVQLRHALPVTPGHIYTFDLPLTMSPSILCSECGLHGWVIKSTWEPA